MKIPPLTKNKKQKDFEERLEAKLDWLCMNINSLDYDRFKKELEKRYPKH